MKRLAVVAAALFAVVLPATAVADSRTFTPSKDSYVQESTPGANFGTASTIRVDARGSDGSPSQRGLIGFQVDLPAGATVTKATLGARATNGSTNGPAVYTASHSWTETGVTWSNQPALTSGVLSDIGAVAAGTNALWDVTAGVAGSGPVTFSLRQPGTDGTHLASRNQTTNPKPTLLVEYSTATVGPPTASFSVTPNPAVRTQPTTFTSTGTCPATPCTYRWFHGDAASTDEIEAGATQPNTSAMFTYTNGGAACPCTDRTVTLTVTDAQGRTATATNSFQLVEPSQPPPPAGGFPDASNTGVPAGTTLTPSGSQTITTAGAVVQNLDISGTLDIRAANVTVRNVRVHGFGDQIGNWSTGLTVEDSEIDSGGANSTCFGIDGGVTIRRSELTGCENGFNVGGSGLAEDNWIHDLTTANGAHTDGAQVNQGASGWTLRHNTIDSVPGTGGCTSNIIMWNEGDPQNSNAWIENNRLLGEGCSFALYCPRQFAASGGIYVNNNRFQRGVFGYTDSCRVGDTITEFNGNVDDATGAPL
jgi:hypothetical protein